MTACKCIPGTDFLLGISAG